MVKLKFWINQKKQWRQLGVKSVTADCPWHAHGPCQTMPPSLASPTLYTERHWDFLPNGDSFCNILQSTHFKFQRWNLWSKMNAWKLTTVSYIYTFSKWKWRFYQSHWSCCFWKEKGKIKFAISSIKIGTQYTHGKVFNGASFFWLISARSFRDHCSSVFRPVCRGRRGIKKKNFCFSFFPSALFAFEKHTFSAAGGGRSDHCQHYHWPMSCYSRMSIANQQVFGSPRPLSLLSLSLSLIRL